MATIVFVRPLLLILVVLGTVLTAVALFTPGWRGNTGLVTRDCGGGCGDWWDFQPGWLRTVIVLMILAFVVEIILLIWAALSFLGICLPGMHFPLAFLCGLAAVLLIVSISVYAAEDGREIVGYAGNGTVGYSYWIAVLAAVVMVLATFAACGVAGFSKMTV